MPSAVTAGALKTSCRQQTRSMSGQTTDISHLGQGGEGATGGVSGVAANVAQVPHPPYHVNKEPFIMQP